MICIVAETLHAPEFDGNIKYQMIKPGNVYVFLFSCFIKLKFLVPNSLEEGEVKI